MLRSDAEHEIEHLVNAFTVNRPISTARITSFAA
jgi:hypothetical protein